MPINQNLKGKVGERELAKVLRAEGFEARRGVQYSGGSDSPDLVGVPGCHVECKRTESFDPYAWLAQAVRDADLSDTPVVVHRRNGKPWIAILSLEEFLNLYRRAHADRGEP